MFTFEVWWKYHTFLITIKYKIMTLELKHLVGYLPYGLKVKTNKGLLELTTIKNGEPEYPFWCETFGDFENEDYNYSRLKGYRGRGFAIEDVIPILHPLSDLTKEIDGVVHAVEIGKLDISIQKYDKLLVDNDSQPIIDYNIINKPFGKVLKVTNCDRWLVYLSLSEPFRCHHYVIDYLLQHHFDVYGLIEKGLAIDVNMIENV